MSQKLYEENSVKAIADAIRAKNGTTTTYKVSEMAGAVADITSEPKLQLKTATPSISPQTIKPDSGYDGLSEVSISAMPAATQATPTISISTAGLITASSAQTAGYVSTGTKSATKQMTTQATKTITPSTSNQTAVAKNVYTTGAITVKGDANLKAENIKKGTSIFGITGTLESGGSSTFALTINLNADEEMEPVVTWADAEANFTILSVNGTTVLNVPKGRLCSLISNYPLEFSEIGGSYNWGYLDLMGASQDYDNMSEEINNYTYLCQILSDTQLNSATISISVITASSYQ